MRSMLTRSRVRRVFRCLVFACLPLIHINADVRADGVVRDLPAAVDRVRIDQTTTDGFIHPGIGFTREALENARSQVIAGRDPWAEGFLALASHPDSARAVSCRNQSQTDPSRPDSDAFDSRGINNRLHGDSYKALRQALMYYFTGEEVYRENAMMIVRVWSKMDPAKYQRWNEDHIHASYPIQRMITAAELLRYTHADRPDLAWTERDTDAFTRNFVVPAVTTFLDGNGWFMNQNGYPIAAAMAGDIFTNDRANYEKRVEWFTVNKDAPNKGWSSSIHDLARLVDRDAITGEVIDPPVVQLIEMGRDQAHAGGDIEIFNNTARLMNAQNTKVDPVTGTISTEPDAVGPYEFLDDRILAAADYFCRFMLGYDTPWVPAAYDIGPNGGIRGVYPRIADSYRGRIRGLDFWDAYHYYTSKKGIDLSVEAPYYHEAFAKRIVNSDTDWVFIPTDATGDAARVPPRVQEPAVVEVERRSNIFGSPDTSLLRQDNTEFVRVTPTPRGTRIALLSADTGEKRIALRIRTRGVTELHMSGLEKPWLLPDTQGKWRYAVYDVGQLERFRDIVFMTFTGPVGTEVDVDALLRVVPDDLDAPSFDSGRAAFRVVAFVGAPVTLDFAAAGVVNAPAISSLDMPSGATLDGASGRFAWTPPAEGDFHFVVNAASADAITARRVHITVAPDRRAARQVIQAGLDPDTPYEAASLKRYRLALRAINAIDAWADDAAYFEALRDLERACAALRPLTPRLPDGSIDFPRLIAASDIGDAIGLLTDGNDDTFPVYTLARDRDYVFDFGEGFRVSVDAFAVEGRLNFEDRARDMTVFGSNDQAEWTRLTRPMTGRPAELSRFETTPETRSRRFRYFRFQKNQAHSPLYELAELRIFGQRYEDE